MKVLSIAAYKKLLESQKTPEQPERCKGCVWGRWEGTKQYCSKQKCVKGEMNHEVAEPADLEVGTDGSESAESKRA